MPSRAYDPVDGGGADVDSGAAGASRCGLERIYAEQRAEVAARRPIRTSVVGGVRAAAPWVFFVLLAVLTVVVLRTVALVLIVSSLAS